MNLLSGIELFVKTVEAGSFSEVGRRLKLAPSSISRQISALETELGARLLNRTTRAISLTEAGQTYFNRVSRILIEIDEARSAINQLQATPSGVLRLNIAIPFGEQIVVPRLKTFLDRYPQITIDLTLEDRFVNLIDERVDLAIRIGRIDDARIVARKLADNRFVLCASPAYLLRAGTPAAPQALIDHNCITNKNIPNGRVWQFRQGKAETSITVTGNFQASTGGALLQAAIAGLGIAALPAWFVHQAIQDKRLTMVLTDQVISLPTFVDSGIYALYPASQFLPPKVRVFIDYMVEDFAQREL